jgi:metallo-beta-lactamase family protein
MSRSFDRDKVSKEDFDRALASLFPIPFGEEMRHGAATFTFRRAQHLLGAAFAEVEIDTGHRKARVTFSGDLGSGGAILLPPADAPSPAEHIVIESTYGNRVREGKDHIIARYGEFGDEVGSTLRAGGDVLIPAFTLGRTQEVMAALDLLIDEGIIPYGTEVYVDSPTAKKVSDVYRDHADGLSARAASLYGSEMLKRSYHREVKSRTSMKVHGRDHRPTVFISSSGDLAHANSPRHFVRMAAEESNLLCIVGWQSYGSLGRQLAEGDSTVFVRYREGGETKKLWVSPAMKIRKFDAFSSHADQDGLVDWAGSVAGLRTACLVHGEPEQAEALARRLETDLGIEAVIPDAGEKIFLPSR